MLYRSGTQLIDPHQLFDVVQIDPHMHVAQFGVGHTGHIAIPLAEHLSDDGVVYAVDILKDRLHSIDKRSKQAALTNVYPVWGDIERERGVSIPERTLDLVFLVNTLSEVRDIPSVLSEAGRLLKDKGRIAVVDWNKPFPGVRSAETDLLDPQVLLEYMMDQGYVLQHMTGHGPYHMSSVFFRHA